MKKRFPGHYRPTDQEFETLWKACYFVPDTNILLHLFRYGENTRGQVLDTLERLKPRVWIPFRVGHEFHRRWREVDQSNRDAYDQLSDQLASEGRTLSGLFEKYSRHQIIDVKQEQKNIEEFITEVCKRLRENKQKHPPRSEAESIFRRISDLIGDSVGTRPPTEEIDALVKEAERRYERLIPPGYKDAKTKDGIEKFGDFLIWTEIIAKAKQDKKPVVVITDDIKEDWWQEFRGEKLGPRPELVEEFSEKAGQRFYLYTLSQFLDYASKYLNRAVDTQAIEEIKTDELQQREREVALRELRKYRLRSDVSQTEGRLRNRLHNLTRTLRHIEDELFASSESSPPASDEALRLLVDRRHSVEIELRQIRTVLRNIRMHKEETLRERFGIDQASVRVDTPMRIRPSYMRKAIEEAPSSDWDPDDSESEDPST